MKRVYKKTVDITRSIRKELKQMREVSQNHLNSSPSPQNLQIYLISASPWKHYQFYWSLHRSWKCHNFHNLLRPWQPWRCAGQWRSAFGSHVHIVAGQWHTEGYDCPSRLRDYLAWQFEIEQLYHWLPMGVSNLRFWSTWIQIWSRGTPQVSWP